MACTTILVGKNAPTTVWAHDRLAMTIPGFRAFTYKKWTVVHPEDPPATYKSVISHVEIPMPAGAMRFTAMPNAGGKGIWAAAGINAANVGMTGLPRPLPKSLRAGR